MPKSRLRMVLAIVALSVLSPLVVMAIFVEDWSRDLTTNRAHTAPGGRVEPWELGGVTTGHIGAAVRLGSPWRLADEKPLPEDSPLPKLYESEPAATYHFVRTTGLMGWKDDVWLVVIDTGEGVRLYAESRSRVGRGDLGQNPRNLEELRDALTSSSNL